MPRASLASTSLHLVLPPCPCTMAPKATAAFNIAGAPDLLVYPRPFLHSRSGRKKLNRGEICFKAIGRGGGYATCQPTFRAAGR
ncbi:hypothetical protein COCSADRAFT_273640 [Bipolaris sorokiniana ND90Pr]|uniref:Uncharacterized protein n=1 Tax=Cochliobolus sativus (strain ND90Pr / ATCC 201652) TaxID=665912 RepID=M2T213_COCSN|nr:uncharacterized protein COCSADRAFT_273640 [Bipolaris sorokiniana ND90Pr]EMD68535.1 hypothetical protein COCSADRAFT_273640 [Bipolaris sorokiniana ND90Pr]